MVCHEAASTAFETKPPPPKPPFESFCRNRGSFSLSMTMSSDSFINLSKVKSILPSFTFRQTVQGERSLFRTSSNLVAAGSAESFYVAGYTPSPGDSPPAAQSQTINVVLFGETGVGKSSVINLVARKEVAKVSSDVNGCTMQSTRHDIAFDGMNFAIFDTIGLEEPQMGVNGYLKAIEKAYELIMRLGAAGGIHLLLFCMRGGRITATTQSNYRLFCECLCNTRVPIALVFTGLEREMEMEDWWTRNRAHIEHYGIKSDGHACITAVQDDTPGEDLKYTESQNKIRELLKTCALKNEAFLPEPHTWFAKIGRGMRSFIEKHKNPKKRDVMKVLTHRCKLDPETARKILDMMEKGDPETKDENKDEQVGNTERESRPNPEVKPDGKDEREVAKENATINNAPPNQLGDIKAEPHVEGMEGKDERRAAKKKDHAPPNQLGDVKAELHVERMGEKDERETAKQIVAKDHAPPNQLSDIKAEPRVEGIEGKVARKAERKATKRIVAKDHAPPNQLGDVKAEPRVEGMEGKDERRAAKKKDHAPPNQLGDAKAELHVEGMGEKEERETAKQIVAKDRVLPNQLGDVKAEPRVEGMEGIDERMGAKKKNVAKDHALPNQLGDVKAESRVEGMEGKDEMMGAKKKNVAKDHALPNQLGDVKAEPRVEGTGGMDERMGAKMNATRNRALPNQLGNVKAEPRTFVTERRDERDVARKSVVKDHAPSNQRGDVKAEHHIDGGQHKYGSGGDQFLGADVAEQAKHGDIKKRLHSSVPSRSRHVVGSQS